MATYIDNRRLRKYHTVKQVCGEGLCSGVIIILSLSVPKAICRRLESSYSQLHDLGQLAETVNQSAYNIANLRQTPDMAHWDDENTVAINAYSAGYRQFMDYKKHANWEISCISHVLLDKCVVLEEDALSAAPTLDNYSPAINSLDDPVPAFCPS